MFGPDLQVLGELRALELDAITDHPGVSGLYVAVPLATLSEDLTGVLL